MMKTLIEHDVNLWTMQHLLFIFRVLSKKMTHFNFLLFSSIILRLRTYNYLNKIPRLWRFSCLRWNS